MSDAQERVRQFLIDFGSGEIYHHKNTTLYAEDVEAILQERDALKAEDNLSGWYRFNVDNVVWDGPFGVRQSEETGLRQVYLIEAEPPQPLKKGGDA